MLGNKLGTYRLTGVVFLCLPDDAAKEAVLLVDESNKNTAIIDASTAHRTNENWVYGFAEIKGQKEKIKSSKRIANPGCHASGFISLVRPLIDEGVLDKNTYLTAFSITGYTGGGKNMIKEYEEDMPFDYIAPRQYGLTQMHKHIPEMMKIGGLEVKPSFCPIVSSFPRGYNVSYADIEALARPVLRHRIKINYNAVNEHLTVDEVIDLLVKESKK